ncbi:hypothetical protein OROMI_026092 [Orobanche minor]
MLDVIMQEVASFKIKHRREGEVSLQAWDRQPTLLFHITLLFH